MYYIYKNILINKLVLFKKEQINYTESHKIRSGWVKSTNRYTC